MTLPTLFKKNKNGSYQQWTIGTNGNIIGTQYGQVDGLILTASKIAEAKNVGRSNEVNSVQQAILEAKSMWKKKLDSGYAESIEAADNVPILPMLAKSYEDHKGKIDWGQSHYVDAKYDGVRSLAKWVDGKVKLFSRKNKEWINLSHIAKSLERTMPEDVVFDGEVYLHGLTFQEISSLTKKHRTIETQNLGDVNTNDLEYHIYDGFVLGDNEVPCSQRKDDLKRWFIPQPSLVLAETHKVNSQKEVDKLHKHYVKQGYEGIIFRLGTGSYSIGHRSADLLKIKTFMDDEFEITGYYEGIGRFVGAVTWICKLPDGREFHCVPKGTMKQKQHYFQHGVEYIGKFLKVKFFEYTDEGLPRFPVGLGVRLEEDI